MTLLELFEDLRKEFPSLYMAERYRNTTDMVMENMEGKFRLWIATVIKEMREANPYNPTESPANTFLALGWDNACDTLERLIQEGKP